ncbi:MAG: ABC transporter permease [Chloroflexi bacterium]|nr:ABC transporter permease [Chloroflexota bacterium]
MIRSAGRLARLYLAQASLSYRIYYSWSNPLAYVLNKLSFPVFTMLLFVYMGKFVGLADPLYIVIGNILLLPATNSINSFSMTVANERQFGSLSYLLGSPASRLAVFLGRGLYHILDGLASGAAGLLIAVLAFRIHLAPSGLLLALACVLLISFTSSGLGFMLGSISLVVRDYWMIISTLSLALYILVGVNFSVELLPQALQAVSYALPMTRGILAARMALAGAGWEAIRLLAAQEALVGLVYVVAGYWLFRWVEKRSRVSGALDLY